MKSCPTCGANSSGLSCEFCGTQLAKPANAAEEIASLNISKAAFFAVAQGNRSLSGLKERKRENDALASIATPSTEEGAEIVLSLIDKIVDDARAYHKHKFEPVSMFNYQGVLDSVVSRLHRAATTNGWADRTVRRIAVVRTELDEASRADKELKDKKTAISDSTDKTTIMWVSAIIVAVLAFLLLR